SGDLRARCSHLHHLLVKERREKKEFRMPEPKACAPLGDAALAQEDRLVAPAQGFAYQGPFLETDALHFARRKLASRRWPSTSTCTPTLFSRATAYRARRKTSRLPAKKACTVLPSPITTPATPSPIS